MAKRFTNTDKYKKRFIRGLPGAYKLLWDYMYHDCNNAGLWTVDFEIAQICIGIDVPVNENEAKKLFKDKIIIIDDGERWFISGFVEQQYLCSKEELNPKNNAHLSVIRELSKYKLIEPLISPSLAPTLGAQNKDKDKNKDIEEANNKTISEKNNFEQARKIYPGTKRGLETEFKYLSSKHKDWKEIIPLLKPAIEKQIEFRKNNNGFIPEWKHFKTWILNRCWEEETAHPQTDHSYEYKPA